MTSLSTYARQFLERLPRPEVDFDLAPAARDRDRAAQPRHERALDGRARPPRSSICCGSLYAHVGETRCSDCERRVEPGGVDGGGERDRARASRAAASRSRRRSRSARRARRRRAARSARARGLHARCSATRTASSSISPMHGGAARARTPWRSLVDRLALRSAEGARARLAEAVDARSSAARAACTRDRRGRRARDAIARGLRLRRAAAAASRRRRPRSSPSTARSAPARPARASAASRRSTASA